MGGFADFWAQSDLVGRAVALLLLAMSVSAWALILWKTWLLRRARRGLVRAVPAFWSAAGVNEGRSALQNFDTEQLLLPLLDAATAETRTATLDAAGKRESRLTRRLRDALHAVLAKLQFGQVLLASIGATAPFVGLFGTVWGIMSSFQSIAASKNTSLAVVAPGIAEALFATAIGLIAAIPATIFYNKFTSEVNRQAARLEGFADEFSAILSRQIDERG